MRATLAPKTLHRPLHHATLSFCAHPGLEISLCSSLGAALNASFRANPLTFQSLFCDMASQTAIVRMCSEWFALCLSLSPSPPQDDDEDERRQVLSPTPQQQHEAPRHESSAAASTPVSPATTAPLTPASSISTPSISGSSPTGLDGTEHAQQVEVRRQNDSDSWAGLTREAGLALGAVVLARRLSRNPGPCLPLKLRSALGLKNDEEALGLVAQGIQAARKAFDIERDGEEGAGSAESNGTTSGPCRFLARELVFDQMIDIPGACNELVTGDRANETNAKGTLLELLTTEYDDRRLAQSARDDCDVKTEQGVSPSAGARRSSPPPGLSDAMPIRDNYSDVCQGTVRTKAFPLGKFWGKQRPDNSTDNSRSPDDSTGADRNSLTYSSSSRDTSIAWMSGREQTSPGTNTSQGVMETIVADYMPEELSSQDNYPPSPLTPLSLDPSSNEQQGGAVDKHFRTPTDHEKSDSSDSPPWFDYEAAVRAAAERLLGTDTDVPPLPLQCPPPRPARPSAGAPAMGIDEEKGREATNNNLGKRVRADGSSSTGHDGREPSTPATSLSWERTNKKVGIGQDGQAARCRTLRRSSPPVRTPEEERLVRWDILTSRIFVALEDDCGCSFCKLGTGLVSSGRMDRQCNEGTHAVTDQSTLVANAKVASASFIEQTHTQHLNGKVVGVVVPSNAVMGITQVEKVTAAATTSTIMTNTPAAAAAAAAATAVENPAKTLDDCDSAVHASRQPGNGAGSDSVSDFVLTTSATQRLGETDNGTAEFIAGAPLLTEAQP